MSDVEGLEASFQPPAAGKAPHASEEGAAAGGGGALEPLDDLELDKSNVLLLVSFEIGWHIDFWIVHGGMVAALWIGATAQGAELALLHSFMNWLYSTAS